MSDQTADEGRTEFIHELRITELEAQLEDMVAQRDHLTEQLDETKRLLEQWKTVAEYRLGRQWERRKVAQSSRIPERRNWRGPNQRQTRGTLLDRTWE